MRATTTLLALAASISTVTAAAYQGFNYGSTNSDGSIKTQQTYQDEFKTAKNLVGTSGFTSARLYTSIQGGTTNDPTFAIPAAIAEDTTLLLGIWASGGQVIVDNEIAALKTAISTYGTSFTSRVTGLSVGSEDLYRISPTGIAAKSGYGAEPDELVAYIQRVRAALADTPLASVPIGHVDTWNDWVNGSNSAVVQAVDWVGVDAYPYYQTSMANSIENGASLFFAAYDATVAAAAGKPVWITETGWPVSGPASGQAVASADNAKTFWDAVACKVLGNINTYWFTLQDSSPVTPSPSFGIVGSVLTTTPIYDLSCAADQSGQSTTSADPTTAVLTSLKEVQVSTAPATEASSTTIPATGGVELTASSSTSDAAISATSVSTVPTRAASAAAEASTTAVPTTLATTPAGAAATAGTVSGSATGAAGNGTVVSPTATTSAFTGAAATAGPMMVGAAAVMAVMAAL